ncbi:unnamed protein product [Parascedosporium putredinis]|uniref:Uncharacterized protein n=1 Tax=Parascedosporium putredinis TaxID=1442378 RepID=A0A9P1HBZ5_9PEZI|nr:unnamed protein product [Parascedosporium putredinis]CAI8004347.1 unnamed protein product [Parascedosporium putredinis]
MGVRRLRQQEQLRNRQQPIHFDFAINGPLIPSPAMLWRWGNASNPNSLDDPNSVVAKSALRVIRDYLRAIPASHDPAIVFASVGPSVVGAYIGLIGQGLSGPKVAASVLLDSLTRHILRQGLPDLAVRQRCGPGVPSGQVLGVATSIDITRV